MFAIPWFGTVSDLSDRMTTSYMPGSLTMVAFLVRPVVSWMGYVWHTQSSSRSLSWVTFWITSTCKSQQEQAVALRRSGGSAWWLAAVSPEGRPTEARLVRLGRLLPRPRHRRNFGPCSLPGHQRVLG